MAPSISVIVPHLNQHDQLELCLQSLFDQDFPSDEFEVIVVDNGSTDVPYDLASRYRNVTLAREPEPGPGPARNRGVQLSKGEILAFIDADCRAEADWLSTIADRFSHNEPKLILGGDVRVPFADSRKISALEAYESVFAYRQKHYIEHLGYSGTGNLAVRRNDFDRIGPFPGIGVAEDRVWGKRASALGYAVVFHSPMVVYHPARRSLREILVKWDRQTRHDYREWRDSKKSLLVWALRATAIAVSPFLDIKKIILSRRLKGMRSRCLAFATLVKTRLYRSKVMFTLLFKPQTHGGISWNKPM